MGLFKKNRYTNTENVEYPEIGRYVVEAVPEIDRPYLEIDLNAPIQENFERVLRDMRKGKDRRPEVAVLLATLRPDVYPAVYPPSKPEKKLHIINTDKTKP